MLEHLHINIYTFGFNNTKYTAVLLYTQNPRKPSFKYNIISDNNGCDQQQQQQKKTMTEKDVVLP